MKHFFYPNEMAHSTYEINFRKWYEKGYRGVVFDIDNTLVPHGEPADKRAIALFEELKRIGFSCIVLSNNKEPRVKMFADAVGIPYIYKASKPNPKNYKKAMEILKTNKENTLFVGDQIFTDVMGANIAELYTILVEPINPKEEIQIVLKRYLEKPIISCFKRKQKIDKHCK